jgi:type IV pilus assembly protein PilM
MFSLFGSSTHQGEVSLGIDIGTTTIKAAEITAQGSRVYTLSNYAMLEVAGHLEHINNALQGSSLRPLESDLTTYLTAIKRQANFKTNHVRASLPSFVAFTTLLEIPLMSNSDTSRSLTTQVKDYIPLPISQVTLDWIKIGEKTYPDGTKKQQIFLVSVPNEKIESYTTIFGDAGFILDGFEVEHLSLARSLTLQAEQPVLIIDIGGRSTTFTVARKGVALFAGQTDFSSNSLTQALATALNISPRRADTLKRQTTIVGGGGSHELSTILVPIIDVILNEAGRARSGFETAFGEKISSVMLAGAGGTMPGFDTYLTSQLGLPVVVADPLQNCAYPPEIAAFSKPLGATLAVALGLALKKIIK